MERTQVYLCNCASVRLLCGARTLCEELDEKAGDGAQIKWAVDVAMGDGTNFCFPGSELLMMKYVINICITRCIVSIRKHSTHIARPTDPQTACLRLDMLERQTQKEERHP